MIQMCEILEMENIDKGTTIQLLEGTQKNIFFLKKGTVKIVDTATGSVKHIVKKGNIFGELALFDTTSNRTEEAITLEDCIVCYIEADKMVSMMQKHPSLKNKIFKIYGTRIHRLERKLQQLLYKDSTARIKDFIQDYILEFGETHENTIVARNLVSHKDIAHLTNTCRQTVSNVLSIMRKEGVINYNTQFISMPSTAQQ